jgi:tetratricopeptide (TPR) repeat protein
MRRTLPGVALLGLAALFAGTVCGCQSPQASAREDAARRWNEARARIKAQLAADRLQAGNVAAASAELATAWRLDPQNPELALLRARVCLAEGKTTQALDLLAHVQLPGRGQAEVEYLKAVAWQQQNRWQAALAGYTRAYELDHTEVAYVAAAAQAWLQLGQPEQALALLTQHSDRFAWTDTYQATLAECYEQLEDWPAAASAWQRVTATPQTATEIHERAAEALYRAGRYEDAIPALLDLLQADRDDTTASVPLMLAECYLALGRPAAAREQLQSVLRRDSEHVAALRLMARCLATAGDLDAALGVAQQALSIDAQDVRTLELTAALAWRTGDCEQAAAAATRLIALDADNPTGAHILGR